MVKDLSKGWVKICGITNVSDAVYAVEAGADAIGIVREPTSPRFVADESTLLAIADSIGDEVELVAVYGILPDTPPAHFHWIQGLLGGEGYQGGPHLIQTIRLPQAGLIISEHAGRVVLDAYSPSAFGGTGKTVDWGLAADFVQASKLPVILAGGLTPDNVAEAIERVRPHGVDVSSGVESSPGIKDPVKVRDFVQAAKASL